MMVRIAGWLVARVCTACAALFIVFAAPGHAQSVPPPLTQYSVDSNGVDIIRGAFMTSSPSLSIGQEGLGGLVYVRTYDSGIQDWRDNVTGAINSNGSSYIVELMGVAEEFTLSGSVFSSTEGRGGTLTFDSGTDTYTYRTAGGALAIYDKDLAGAQPTQANEGRVTTLTLPSGEVLTFTYTVLADVGTGFLAQRLQSVTNTLGYQLSFEYQSNTADATGIRLVEVTAINNAVDYCDPTANGCSGFTETWPTLTFGVSGATQTATDALGRETRYAFTNNRLTGVRWPSSGSDNVAIAYNNTTGRVLSVTTIAGAWIYNYDDLGSVRTAGVVDPLSHQSFFVSDTATNRVTAYFNAMGRTWSYGYDGQGRLTRITAPEGNYTEYEYDGRGNIIETTLAPKSGSGLSSITLTASYPSTCADPLTCNQPSSTTDGRGNTTDYTYDAAHGGLLTVTLSDPDGGGPLVRPQTRFSYTALYAYYKDSGGSIVAAPTPVYRLSGVSACAVAASCANGADETRTTAGYGPTGVANNLLPVTVSSGAGDNSLTATSAYTWDVIGNLLSIDGPLSGAADLTRIRYDAMRQTIGVIGPDPDGGGALEHRAVRYTYNGYGLASLVERGTVDSQSDGDWAGFASLEQIGQGYDSLGRRTSVSFSANGSIHELAQYSYDAANRLECVAMRMNSAAFGSTPSSACALGAEGPNGPDRITRFTYDAADRVIRVTNGFGTEVAQDTVTRTYTLNGLVETLADARGNLTTNVYDGFDRLRRIRFPNASGGGSSTTDYEQYSYDASFNVTEDRRRDGSTIAITYDALNRATTMTPSSGASISFAYDNFSRRTSIGFTGHALTFVYDQLSRNIRASGPLGDVDYQYDLAGRRTRITWPDAFYVQYDFDLTDAVTSIRENGATSGPGVLASYGYDNLGRRVSVSRGNGVETSYSFDSASRLSEIDHDLASTAEDQVLSFTYNAANQVLSRSGSNAAYDWPQPSLGFANYDPNGRNQYSAVGASSFTYDARGNLTSDGTTNYTYDLYNRLIEAGGATLGYDPAGRLYETDVTSVITRFLYAGATIIAEYDDEDELLRRYVPGPSIDEPVVWYEGDDTSDRRWLVADRLGSVIAVTDADGEATSINSYDEYGRPAATNTGRFQYTGQPWLDEASLYHYRTRAYDPILGRFMQTDPILYAGGMNLYAYVVNDPVNRVDPSGLFEFCITRDLGEEVTDDDDGGISVTVYRGRSCLIVPRLPHRDGGGNGGGGEGDDEQTHPLLDPLQLDICSLPQAQRPVGYADLNVSYGSRRLLGVTGGMMVDLQTGDIYAYVGAGAMSAGTTVSATRSYNARPTTGWNVAGQINPTFILPLSFSHGRSWGTSPGDFDEIGIGTRGASLTAFYSWKIGNLCDSPPAN